MSGSSLSELSDFSDLTDATSRGVTPLPLGSATATPQMAAAIASASTADTYDFNFDLVPGDASHEAAATSGVTEDYGYGYGGGAADTYGAADEEDEYDDFGNLIPKKKKDQGPSIWDMPLDIEPVPENAVDTESERSVSVVSFKPATYEKISNRVHSVTKEPGIPLESSTLVPQALRVLRRHSLFQEMYWNDFYRLCTSSGLIRAAKLPKGTVLMEQGVSVTRNGCGEFCFFLVRGRVSVLKDGVEIATLKDEAAFGEEAVMYRQPAATSLVTAATCDIYSIDAATYKQLAHRKRLAARRSFRL